MPNTAVSSGLQTRTREKGHFFRRFIHLSMVIVPYLFYWQGTALAHLLHLTPVKLLCLITAIILSFEVLRIWKKWQIYGQREYETERISATAWTTIAITLVLLLAPKTGPQNAAIGTGLILAMTLTDPLMGEARLWQLPPSIVVLTGLLASFLVWGGCALWLGAPWWLSLIMPPLTVAAEWRKFNWIDDNAMMLLLPLSCTLLLSPWL